MPRMMEITPWKHYERYFYGDIPVVAHRCGLDTQGRSGGPECKNGRGETGEAERRWSGVGGLENLVNYSAVTSY